jgi:hypothetical protein
VPGLGHPQHAEGDPRALLLLDLARKKGVAGKYVEMLHAIRDALPEAIGRPLPINVNGAIPAVMLDAGFPRAALNGISLLARTAGLIGHSRRNRSARSASSCPERRRRQSPMTGRWRARRLCRTERALPAPSIAGDQISAGQYQPSRIGRIRPIA